MKVTRTDQRNHHGTALYRLDASEVERTLRTAASLPECAGAFGALREALETMADRYSGEGEPWSQDDGGDLYDLTDFEVSVMRAAAKAVRDRQPTA